MNGVIGDKMGVTSVVDKMREATVIWLGHVKRRCRNALVKRCGRLDIAVVRRGRGKLKKNWEEVIRQDMIQLQLTEDEDITLD